MAQQYAGQMLQMLNFTITVTPSEETKEINGWNCKKYEMIAKIPMGQTVSEIWATEDVACDPTLYQMITHSMMTQLPNFEEILPELLKMKGVPTAMVRLTDGWHSRNRPPTNFIRVQLYLRNWFERYMVTSGQVAAPDEGEGGT